VASALPQTLEEHAETLEKKCVHMALQGNTTAMRLCMERLVPARRHRVLQFKLPPIKTLADLASASEKVIRGVASGLLTPGEGQTLAVMFDGRRRMIETQELEVRIRALEESRSKL
jgi:hypothetical protein